jgi:hypothetical protein
MEVQIVLGGVTIIIVVAFVYYQRYLRRRAAALAGACGLFTDWVFPDECLGVCPPVGGVAQRCTVLTTRPYFGGLGTQAATCACRLPPPGATPGVSPGGATTTAGQ